MEIDYVVPMVFHHDKEWQENFGKAGSWYDESLTADFVRYRSWGNECLLIECVKRFMPFVRTIYIILAQESQVQPWMKQPKVRVVFHRDIIPERYLPMFNSQSMEMYLKDIPDLSEYFIYGNDDMFPLSELREEDFFVDGKPCTRYEELSFPKEPNIFHLGCRNGLNFIAREFGRHYDTTWIKCVHGLMPMRKSTWEWLWYSRPKEIEDSVSAFREPKNFNQYLCPWWHYFAREYVDRVPRSVYVNTKDSLSEVIDVILSEETQVVCINDNEWLEDITEYSRIVNKAIEKRLEG
jgi:hypothetical protein